MLSPQDEKFLKNFGRRVRQLGQEEGWTLEECEEHGWLFWRHLQQIETGKKNINITTLRTLSELFNTEMGDLFI
jgi:transcriptional regulator with XRE-family HTH domain